MSPLETTNHEKRQARRKKTAEDFTPSWLVDQMLDELPESTWQKDKTFLDPACGNGNMLVRVLLRKLSKGHPPLQVLQTIFGTDIMPDNVNECRFRLLQIVSPRVRITEEMVRTVFTNIVCTPKHKFKNGSLDYDFSFPPTKNGMKTIQKWIELPFWAGLDDAALDEENLELSERLPVSDALPIPTNSPETIL